MRLLACKQIFNGGIKNRVGDGADDADSGDFIFGRLANEKLGVPLMPRVPASAVSF
jgi:hypothetical protein